MTPLEFKELARIRKKVGTTIEHSYIPTVQDVQSAGIEKFIDEIRHQQINDEATEIVSALEEDMDLSHISFKLISMLLEKRSVKGPDSIGIDAARLKKMLEKLSHDKNREKGKRRYSSRSRRGRSSNKKSGSRR